MYPAQKAAYALAMLVAATEVILDELHGMGHELTPIENSAADFAGQIAQHMAERVALDPKMIENAVEAGERLAEEILARKDDVTPPSHQLGPAPEPDRSLN